MIRVVVESEEVATHRPARVLVWEDGKLVVEVVAEIGLQQGADGGYYHRVLLTERRQVAPGTQVDLKGGSHASVLGDRS